MKSLRLVGVWLSGSAVVLATTLVPTAASGETRGPELIDESDCSTVLPLDRVTALLPDGTELPPVPGDGLARKYYFTLGASDVTQIVPPAGWTPIASTVQELYTYGFPARPTDPIEFQTWLDEWSQWRRSVEPGMCQTSKHSLGSFQSTNWAGGMNSGAFTYTQAKAKWYQTGFDGDCGTSGSGYATWAGIGGHNDPKRLLQAGTVTVDNSLNGIKMFWEAISHQYDTHVIEFIGSSVAPGDHVLTYTTYENSTAGAVAFTVYDLTSGESATTGRREGFNGYPAFYYYDGSTTDFVTEPPLGGPGPGGYYYLRKPHLLDTYFDYATSNGAPIADYPASRLTNVGVSGRTLQTSGFDGVHAWRDYWHYCS